MCTVTIILTPGATIRLACNRDEARLRPAALPPRVRRFGERCAILPIDPLSRGTWIAVNDAGLAMTVLNVTEPGDVKPGSTRLLSRGTIIPALLHCATLESALQLAEALLPAHYAPFRLVVADRQEVAELHSSGRHMQLRQRAHLCDPVLFTSSGLGDHVVEGPRRKLFEASFGRPDDWHQQQDAFHRHRWAEQPQWSVCMRRADAQTVSHTVVTIGQGSTAMTYYSAAPDQAVAPISVVLNLQSRGAA